MKKNTVALIVALCCISLYGGCSSSAVRYYGLTSLSFSGDNAPQPNPGCRFFSVTSVTVPENMNRPQIVTNIGSNRVMVDDFNIWAVPLKDEARRIITQNLLTILPCPPNATFQNTEERTETYRITVDFLQWDAIRGKMAFLDALWIIRDVEKDLTRTGRSRLTEPLTDRQYETLAAGYSRLLNRISEEIAQDALAMLKTNPDGKPEEKTK